MKSDPTKSWLQSLPRSPMVYPERFVDQLKYFFWRLINPIHPHLQDLLIYMRVLRHEGRDNYLLGKLAPHVNIESLVAYLADQGFGHHPIAWKEHGQLLSLRYAPNFKYQYHLRVFHDGEVRGHFEYTTECHPFLHILEIDMEDRHHEFRALLRDFIVPA